ncbi:hypothetical protein M422DRAFT_145268, partial [Sphaerobolus stellatus SS14]
MAPHALIGKQAPKISLLDQNGEKVTIQPGSTGTPLAIFFYPASGTCHSACTKEACGFRDALKTEVFQRSSISIVGISGDAVSKQKEFVDQNGLPYPILSDARHAARKAYQVKKGHMGFTEGRVTYFIDSRGIVKDVTNSISNFKEHIEFVRKRLETEEKGKAKAEPQDSEETTSAS